MDRDEMNEPEQTVPCDADRRHPRKRIGACRRAFMVGSAVALMLVVGVAALGVASGDYVALERNRYQRIAGKAPSRLGRQHDALLAAYRAFALQVLHGRAAAAEPQEGRVGR